MSDREVMQQALEALETHAKQYPHMVKGYTQDAVAALRARLAEPETCKPDLQVEGAEAVAAVAKNATAQFDHAIGADRFKVVRGPYWWHVLIGDSTKEHGKFHSRAGAEKMAADLLRQFRNGAFVQRTAPPARPLTPVQEAAPELLEALCALVLGIDAGGATLDDMRNARAAIAKAEGANDD